MDVYENSILYKFGTGYNHISAVRQSGGGNKTEAILRNLKIAGTLY